MRQLREPNRYRRERDSDSNKWWIDFSHWVDREVCDEKKNEVAIEMRPTWRILLLVGAYLVESIDSLQPNERIVNQNQPRQIINALHIEVTSPLLENTYLEILRPYFISTMQFMGHTNDLQSRVRVFFVSLLCL